MCQVKNSSFAAALERGERFLVREEKEALPAEPRSKESSGEWLGGVFSSSDSTRLSSL